ncbi:mucin-2-like [Scophthalmus maximus]|uniref:mucin-2-like n=1 Tax=Scophthalmus maximus TaxID=52904 RepID=UPI001FA85B6C|nr:mucin-2-like [Scophthalmus maximus]
MEYHSGGSLPLLGRPRYCPGANANGGYLCETGHCCGETGCCTYYYELWWFWLLWTVLILFSCCCAYRHRRAKLRVQQQQRQREISLLAYHGANSYPSSMLDLSFLASLKLPSYEEVAAQPSTPPPPYSSVFTTPRYPQPPRTVDPHLLTQHDPLLHRPLSDGPSSLSSDNSSSCSCDSCCPSSPCSSSLSAPVTYETDTSHASTPSEAAPLTLDVTMETITAAASCLEVNETRIASESAVATVVVDIDDTDAVGAQETVATDSSVPNQTVTVAVVTGEASPSSPAPAPEVALPVGTASSMKQQLDLTLCTMVVSTCSSSILPGPSVVDTALPTIPIINTEAPAEASQMSPAPKTPSLSSPSAPTESTSDRPTPNPTVDTVNLTRTFDTAIVPGGPTIAPSPDVERTLALLTGSAGLATLDPNFSLVPIPVPSNLTQAPDPVPTNQAGDTILTNYIQSPEAVPTNPSLLSDPITSNLSQAPELVPSKLTPVPDPQTKTTLVPDCTFNPVLTSAHSKLTLATDAAPTLSHCQNPELSPESGLTPVPPSPVPDLPQISGAVAVLASCLYRDAVAAERGPCVVLTHFSESDTIGPLMSNSQGLCSRSGTMSAPAPVLTVLTPPSSCPAITIECESYFPSSQSPPSSPSSLPSPQLPPSPPALPSTSLTTPALLLDPLTALHQSDKGGSSSCHASSLSPSPRATQSPPKQTLFSPCVDVFEPVPPNWEDGEEEQEDEDNDDEDDDMGADESQYRHRRLTGDSGIEVCRCRVEKEDEEEEEEEEEEEQVERKEDSRRGGGAGERDKKGGGNTDLHDSVDCPDRGQITTGEELTLCDPTSSTTPSSEDSGKVVIVMETV